MSIQISDFPFHPTPALKFRANKTTTRSRQIFASTEKTTADQQQQVNLSVLRFTFGIPGLDESYLPRWIGYGFGSLLILNHLSASGPTSESQQRTEALGLAVAAFSIALPYIGKFLKGSEAAEQRSLPEEGEQVFVISSNIGESLKQDLAWATYVLLRNTSTIAVLISVQGELCVRGYWNCPVDMSKAQLHDWFKRKVDDDIGLGDVKETLYFPQYQGSGTSWDILPNGTRSLYVQPLVHESQRMDGFLLVASTAGYAYSDKDRAWIGAIAEKFKG